MQDIGLIVCADSGDFGIRFFVDTAGFPQVDVCTQVADHEDDVFCGDIFNVRSNRVERFDSAGIIPSVVSGKTERRKHPQPAGTAAHIPGLAGSQMIEQRLVVPLHNHTDINNTGIPKGRQSKVNQAVTAANWKRRGCAFRNKLTQLGIGFVCKNDAMIVIHRFKPPRPYRPWRLQQLLRLLLSGCRGRRLRHPRFQIHQALSRHGLSDGLRFSRR